MTVLVPTFRRPAGLARVLAGLSAQVDPPPYEVLVVDNDPRPHPVPDLPVHTRLVAEPIPGAAAARNRGIAEAETELLAMLDDDVVPDPGWLRALADPVLEGLADLTGGKVLLAPDVARPGWLRPGLEGYLTALDLGPAARELRADESLLTASLLTRTALLRQIGGFDTRLGPRPGQQIVGDDVRLVRDLRAAGARAQWVPAAVVVHELPPDRLRRSWLLRRAYLQGRSDWRVDRELLQSRVGHGTRVAASWWREQLSQRTAEGLTRPGVAFHAACDLARTAGALTEAASWRVPGAGRDGLVP